LRVRTERIFSLVFSIFQECLTSDNEVKIIRKSSSSLKKSSQADLDLTGSPLKVSFTLDEDEEDDFQVIWVTKRNLGPDYNPLSTQEARYFSEQD
jgi:hypothetical protein